MSEGTKDAQEGTVRATTAEGWCAGSHDGRQAAYAPSIPSDNPHVRAFVRSIREQCAGISTCDPPKHWLADSLRAQRARMHGLAVLTPADDELIEREIRRGTNT